MTRRTPFLVALLAVVLLCVPNSSVNATNAVLVEVEQANGVDLTPDVTWILVLGSDARPGQAITRQRADAIQLVGINSKTGAATVIGVPRDSWVSIPGRGNNKINAAMSLGGPQLMARAVQGLIGIEPDFVMVADFVGFQKMIDAIGPITINSPRAFSYPNFDRGRFVKGANQVKGKRALIFARERKNQPRGDFDRSANQQAVIRAIHARIQQKQTTPGFLDKGVWAVLRNMDMQVSPAQAYKLSRAIAAVDPKKITGCVVGGSEGTTGGGASVVFPNRSQAQRYGKDARDDAVLKC
ncbi:LCP family protein [Nocardioides sp. AE5]|uniref:LCP family protein n=1 Tax=Nocardioides sp. AE5 TaxID=2962573 RepID=UPI002882635D|nr:LCP family protein [Nocardioides sp. AE5]MDT0200978.1 LCP family protein [Nocardioides sp. AE5]